MSLKQNSDPVDHGAMLQDSGLLPASGYGPDVGSTSIPVNALAPAYEIGYSPADDRVKAEVVIRQRASEGTNTSIHLRAGIFETNATLVVSDLEADRRRKAEARLGSYLTEFRHDSKNRVYFVMPADLAERNRRAEVEHCDDLIYAYQQTLGALDAALASVRPVTAATKGQAGEQIAAAIQAALPPQRARLGPDPAAWRQEYERLSGLTRERDQASWHDFGLELVDSGAVPGRANPTYLTGASRDPAGFKVCYLRFTTGTTEIGTHSTAQVIV
ncbi:hypothetical protein [Actinomadura sp. NTSP31]|uniref:hypothetical protein n=1 Tax=Actinomadura sp. NTSP31 TaxID=1735447 RepID=UPI0035C131FD